MNTPRTKPRVRRRADDLFLYRNKLGGTYRNGITDPTASKLIGEIVSLWPHTEESLVSLLAALINDPMRSRARNIYWTINSQNARVKVMRALLERTFENAHRTKLVDEILDEFVMLKNKRNAYVHGLWWTHENGKLFLTSEPSGDIALHDARVVPIKEIEKTLKDMLWFNHAIALHGVYSFSAPSLRPLPDTLLGQHDEGPIQAPPLPQTSPVEPEPQLQASDSSP